MDINRILQRLFLLSAVVVLISCASVNRSPGDTLSGASWSDPSLGEYEEPPLPEIRPEGLTAHEINSMQIYRDNIRAIVNVTTVNLYRSRFMGSYSQEGSGSGVIVSDAGYVLTNKHVITDADYMVITLYDGTNYQARGYRQ